MARFNSNSVSKIASSRSSDAWGKTSFEQNSTLVFAALLIVCSLAVGCSSEKPKSGNQASPTPVAQVTPPPAITPASAPIPTAQSAPNPVQKKVVRKIAQTVTFADKNSGVTFRYPRKYVLKSGDRANEVVSEQTVPTSFVQPGGVTVAAVIIPEGIYPKSDLASAMFDVSVNQALTREQCAAFSSSPASATPASEEAPALTAPVPSSLLIGDMELEASETLADIGKGKGKESSKYYHVFENGSCYEFALKVATTGEETDEGGKPVDRQEVFKRLGKILATVKIAPIKSSEVTASVPAASAATTAVVTPAQ